MSSFLEVCLHIAMILVGVGFLILLVCLLRGPSLADRVMVLDLMTVLAVSFMGLVSIYFGQPVFLDPAIALALISFLGTVAFARYLEKKGVGDD